MKLSYAYTMVVLEVVIFSITTGNIIGSCAGAAITLALYMWAMNKGQQHA